MALGHDDADTPLNHVSEALLSVKSSSSVLSTMQKPVMGIYISPEAAHTEVTPQYYVSKAKSHFSSCDDPTIPYTARKLTTSRKSTDRYNQLQAYSCKIMITLNSLQNGAIISEENLHFTFYFSTKVGRPARTRITGGYGFQLHRGTGSVSTSRLCIEISTSRVGGVEACGIHCKSTSDRKRFPP